MKSLRNNSLAFWGIIVICLILSNFLDGFAAAEETGRMKAIIVAGGGPSPENSLWNATRMCSNFAYRTMSYRGFTKEDIFYLSSDKAVDLDINGKFDDVDLDATNSNLEWAITEWAKDAESLVLYLTGPGGEIGFRMNYTEVLSSVILSNWLNTLQEVLPGKMIVIYDASYSGTFISSLTPPAGKERILIASSVTGNQYATFASNGTLSFSSFFWREIMRGTAIWEAFFGAENSVRYLSGRIDTGEQRSGIDTDGNGILNEKTTDGILAEDVYIKNDNSSLYESKPVFSINKKMKAVIVAGGGPTDRTAGYYNSLWEATEMRANFVYRALIYQGFTKDSIYYLSSNTMLDLDANGEADDVDGDVTNSNLEDAITEWAKDADSLMLYLTGHGGDRVFRMSRKEILYAADLGDWVNILQETLTGKVIVVSDHCESGSFMPFLRPHEEKERIVITGTSAGEPAYFVSQGSISFSGYFWTHIFNGINIFDAFNLSKNAMENPIEMQHPLIDANGNGIPNETEDFISVSNIYISNRVPSAGDYFKPNFPTDKKVKSLIVAGGGPTDTANGWYNSLWDSTQKCTNFAYQALAHQGFASEDIYYLSSDTEAEEVDAAASKANLQQAITEWAQDADDLVIYLADHGGTDVFRMNSGELLSASELDSWIDTLQATLPGKVTVVYDACKSGSFVSSLTPPAGKERITIASASPDEPAYFIGQGSISFSNCFWTNIFNGINLENSFGLATKAMETPDFQHPLIDTNGNGIGNEPEDFELLGSVYISNGTVFPSIPPAMMSVSPEQTINGTNAALIYASGIKDEDGIARVWAVIKPPNWSPDSADNPVLELPSLDLLPVGSDRYENTYTQFNTEGTYRIAIYARDGLGNLSVPQMTAVTVINPLKCKAIIAGGGPQSDSLWQAAEKNTILAYEALKSQGYSDEDIYFLSMTTASTGVDGLTTKSNLRYAIEGWASQNGWELLIYMIGNDREGNFQISETENVSPQELDAWLDNLQESLPGKVTVVYDACRSGNFIASLTPPDGKERILIASASGTQCPNFFAGGALSFSGFFWKEVIAGSNIMDAFVEAKRMVRYLGDVSGMAQTPCIDDNGNGIPNEKSDGDKASAYTVGAGVKVEISLPFVGAVSGSQTLNGETSATIRAENVISAGTVDQVLAVIVPPGAVSASGSVLLSELPVLQLMPVGNGRYEGVYDDFSRLGIYRILIYASDTEGDISSVKETQIEQKKEIVETDPPDDFTAGIFTVGDRGIVEIEWLYDGGMYEGEFGVFSLSGMDSFTPGSPEFIKEAARRALSHSEKGYVVFSDPAERARFSGALNGETKDWNAGPYKGVGRLDMTPGDQFATMLVPNDSIENLFNDPGTAAVHKRPLFSLIAPNPAYGMYLGQVADVNGLGRAFVYEDMDASHSDLDYNDFIFQVFGASVNEIPSLDDIVRIDSRKRKRSNWFDWRTQTALGKEIMAHVESPAISDETLWLSVETDAAADLFLYDIEGREIGKAGGYIPGAMWSLEENGHQFVYLLPSENGKYDYRAVLHGSESETCRLTLKVHLGYSEIISEETKEIEIEAYQIVNADISGEVSSGATLTISERKAFFYDFDSDGDVDDADIQKVSSCWNTSKGDPGYDPLYDLDGDGAITILDIMRVSGGKPAP